MERDIAFDLSHGSITRSLAVAVVGRSTATRLPPDLRWIPLTEPIALTVAHVLPAGDPSATAQRFEELAHAHADTHGWLAPPGRCVG